MRFVNGDNYNGRWQNDLYNGRGEFKFNNGESMKGLFNNGKF
jgi:hypothetical protein